MRYKVVLKPTIYRIVVIVLQYVLVDIVYVGVLSG